MMRLPIRKRVPYLGLLLAFALMLSYIEAIIPFNIGAPGAKLGLSNLSVVLCLMLFSPVDAFLLTILKALLSSLLFGNAAALIYSLAGAVVSCAIMLLANKITVIHIPTVSALGGVSHNMAQLFTAYFITGASGIFYYTPVLVLAGFITGLVLGFLAIWIKPYIAQVISGWQGTDP